MSGSEQKVAVYTIPLKTVPGMNAREHWRKRAARVKAERAAVALVVRSVPVPCTVHMVRLSPGLCDDDNLRGALKAVRDEVARIAGVDDGPMGPIVWEYSQDRCKRGRFGIRLEIKEA